MSKVNTINRSIVTGHEMLSRYVTNKPKHLKNKIILTMNAGGVVWRHSAKPNVASDEICTWDGLDFLGNGKAKTAWEKWWQGSHAPALTWDAIGRVQIGKVGWNWLLVSTMINVDELTIEPFKPSDKLSPAMSQYLSFARKKYKVDDSVNWPATSKYVQQLAALAFLRDHGVCVQLLNIVFEEHDDSARAQTFATTSNTLAINTEAPLCNRIHQLILPVMDV